MAQTSTDPAMRGPLSAEEVADLLTGDEARAVQHLPDLWNDLTPQQQTRVAELGHRLGETLSELSTVAQVARRQAQIQRNQSAIALLQSWAQGDEADAAEQRETWEYLKRVLDEDRLSDRPLFS